MDSLIAKEDGLIYKRVATLADSGGSLYPFRWYPLAYNSEGQGSLVLEVTNTRGMVNHLSGSNNQSMITKLEVDGVDIIADSNQVLSDEGINPIAGKHLSATDLSLILPIVFNRSLRIEGYYYNSNSAYAKVRIGYVELQ